MAARSQSRTELEKFLTTGFDAPELRRLVRRVDDEVEHQVAWDKTKMDDFLSASQLATNYPRAKVPATIQL